MPPTKGSSASPAMSHLLLHTGMGGVAFTICVGDQSTRQSMVANAGHSPVSSMALKARPAAEDLFHEARGHRGAVAHAITGGCWRRN